jgi:NADH:ubiquinone oxidoreductase subunit 2 (subunit N)
MLSLAGVPPLAGFFGEFAVAAQLASGGSYWLLALAILGAVFAAAAVVRALRLVYLLPPGEEARRLPAGVVSLAGSVLAAVVLVAYVVLAYPISGLALEGVKALGSR